MTEEEKMQKLAQAVADEAARKAVAQTLASLGVDVTDPFEVQKDMAAMRDMRLLLRDPEFQADLAQIRALRTSGNFIRTKAGAAMITVLVTGVLGLLFLGLQSYLGIGGNETP